MRTESCRDEHTARREELFGALVQLRESPSSPNGGASHAWDVVVRHVHRMLPTDCEDERQAALLAVLESVGALRATSPASAAGWVRTICRNHRVDAHRARHVGRDKSYDDGRAHSTGEPDLPAELAERVLDAFALRVDAHLERSLLRPATRARRRTQAMVALRRLALEETLPEIAEHLSLDVSLDLLTKWVERGRAVVLATIAHDREREPDVADFFAPLAELALERRADAGRPRPERRRRPS
jgi:DNA-directed RNA polymerase specialized sigma24 family protein